MAEFSIIEEFCQGIGPSHTHTKVGVGDDAAVVAIPDDMELAVSIDTMVAGVHFLADASPASIAHKLLAVNLSDMAAMGAKPKWATLALSIPSLGSTWLSEFSDSLKRLAEQYQVQLIGGDTTQGPLNLSINIMGLLPKGKALCRSGAAVGDDVYVSHCLGDAALGLQLLEDKLSLNRANSALVVTALERPTPRVELGLALLDIASACLDVSDGLIGDLGHICEQSEVSIEIDVDAIPVSAAYQEYLNQGGDMSAALSGGDDYELAFTAPAGSRTILDDLASQLGISLTQIGRVLTKSSDLAEKVLLTKNGKPYALAESSSFEHFS